jgi:hypothetical protein
MRRLGGSLAASLLLAALGAGCAPVDHPGSHLVSSANAQKPGIATVAVPSTAAKLPGLPWSPPAAAVIAARRYVTAALSYSWTLPPNAWIAQVSSVCTPEWAAAVAANSDGGAGGWPAVVATHQSAVTSVTATYPSAGPGPGRRLEVTATVTITGTQPSTRAAALAVDLLQADGTWLVGWAG